jgi:protein tyrosine phosphatase (PTP) superfamily phosphohydrolase (DUF442 family)
MSFMIWLRRFFLLLVISNATACAHTATANLATRPKTWATPVTLETGLPNLFRVNANLYRSAQPTREGFLYLNTLPPLGQTNRPIKTVLTLRDANDDYKFNSADSELVLKQIPFHTWHPEDEDVITFLRIVNNPELQPVLVHCKHGSDRTGMMIAIYHIAYDGWSKQQAIDEMIHGGYGFHPMWQNLVRYINKLDIEAIKAEVTQQQQ